MRIIFWHIIIIFSGISMQCGANTQYNFKYYTKDDGLISNTIFHICQDSRDYMWFGSVEGICRFDSYAFKKYDFQSTNPTISNLNNEPTRIEAINLIGIDELWIGTNKGVFKYDYIKSAFVEIKEIDPTFEANSFTAEGNNVWISSNDQGILCYNKLNGSIKYFTSPRSLTAIVTTKKNKICAISRDNGIYTYNDNAEAFTPVNVINNSKLKISTSCAIIDANDNLWLGDWSNGLFKYDYSTGNLIHYSLNYAGKPIERIHSVIKYSDNEVMVGSDYGITVVSIETGQTHTITSSNIINSNTLNNRFVYPLCLDRNGGIWAGTYFGGVNYLSYKSNYFSHISNTLKNSSSLGQVVSKFCEDKSHNIWIGTDDSGLHFFNRSTLTTQRVSIGADKEPLNIHSLCVADNSLWVGTYQTGLYNYNLTTKAVIRHTEVENIYALLLDSRRNLWAGSPWGLYKYNWTINYFEKFSGLEKMNGVKDIEQDEDNIWIVSSLYGLTSINKSTFEFKHYDKTITAANINLDDLICLHCMNGKIWLGLSQHGLRCLDIASSTLTSIPSSALLTDDISINYITSSDNKLWITTSHGLFRYNIKTGIINKFTKTDGLQSNQFNQNSGLKTSDGQIFIGGVNGFNYFNPRDIPNQGIKTEVMFTDLQVIDDQYRQYSIPLTNTIKLKHTESVFSIEFASIYYPSQSKIIYKYQLEGFDATQIKIFNNNNKVTYTNVPAGSYRFKVTSTDTHGVWSEKYTTMTIIILPPWWLSLYIKIAYFLVALCAIFLVAYYSIRRIKRKNQEKINLLEIENEKQSIESKMIFFTNIAHEIRTPATLISGPIETIMNSKSIPADILEDMEIIQKNSCRLIDLVGQMLDLKNVERGYVTVNLQLVNITTLIKNLTQQYKTYCIGKGVNLKLNIDSDEDIMSHTDPEVVSKIINNLLANAIKFTKNCVWITLEPKEESCFTITVLDNGNGISPENITKVFQPFFTTSTQINRLNKGFGIGLSLASKLAKQIDASIEVTSTYGSYAQFVFHAKSCDATQLKPQDDCHEISDYQQIDDMISIADEPHQHTVLIVEDNKDLLDYLYKNISKQYNAVVAGNGKEAISIIRRQRIDIVISDIVMPVMDGIELCEKLKQNIEFSHIPIIILSARSDVQSQIVSVANGADVYLGKPTSITLIYAHIAGLLEKRARIKTALSSHPNSSIVSMVDNDIEKIFFQKIDEIIQDNISNPDFSVEDLAQHICISRSGLYAKLKTVSELSPNEFIRMVRLRKAADYILTKEYKINEICYLVGFNSPSYFTKCFVKLFGVLPKDYCEESSIKN